MTDDQPSLFAITHTRRTDPETSYEAADSVTHLRTRQFAILDTLRRIGPSTDERIAENYRGPQQSPSGLRTRRKELVDLGLVVDTGKRRTTEAGRQSIVWRSYDW